MYVEPLARLPRRSLLQAAGENNANLAIYSLAFLLTTLGIVYVQEAERKIPMNYANRYRAGALSRQSYLPFKARLLLAVGLTRLLPHKTGVSALTTPSWLAVLVSAFSGTMSNS
jgi:preprotein translocase subunit SecY